MKVLWLVFPKVHPDHDAKENRNNRHALEYTVVLASQLDKLVGGSAV